ncbi:hypothetical protein KM043_000832 [Ampulex compressa]|nr:hypothetical protein KM043_000832 [Ampulex compressa]
MVQDVRSRGSDVTMTLSRIAESPTRGKTRGARATTFSSLARTTPDSGCPEEHSTTSFYQRSNRPSVRRSLIERCSSRRRTRSIKYSRGIADKMRVQRAFFLLGCYFLVLTFAIATPRAQEPSFELPVQLIGFPIIIAAVRITNFVKKLAYSLSPDTYADRTKRSLPLVHDEEILDVGEVEKRLVAELGDNVCVYERICSKYAARTLGRRSRARILDWGMVFGEYKSSPNPMKENYLLSVFLGDIIGSPMLCHQLAKRGRACDDATLAD